MSDFLQFLTVLASLTTAVITVFITYKKLDSQGETIKEIKVQVNGNYQVVKDQVANALNRVAELEEELAEERKHGHQVDGEKNSIRALQEHGVFPVPETESNI